MKRTFTSGIARVPPGARRDAATPAGRTGWRCRYFEGPSEYLYGEETALLETIDGRYPFPRIAPPYRRGVEEVVEHPSDVTANSASAAHVEMAAPERRVGRAADAGQQRGDVRQRARASRRTAPTGSAPSAPSSRRARSSARSRAGPTPRRRRVPDGHAAARGHRDDRGGPEAGHRLHRAAVGRVEPDPARGAARHADVATRRCGLSAAGSARAATSCSTTATTSSPSPLACPRFLAVESCGQCTPCKQDGLAIWSELRPR